MGVRTPEQLVRVFYSTYDPESVREDLWKAFQGFAQAILKGNNADLPHPREVVKLFNGLINLVEAVYDLREKTTGRCVICGRSDDSSFNTNGGGDSNNNGLDNAG